MKLSDLVSVSRAVASTRSRLKKRALLSDCLRAAAPNELALVVSYLAGTLPQGRIGLGPSILRKVAGETQGSDEGLELVEVDSAFAEIAATTGTGSQRRRQDALGRLFQRAGDDERVFLIRLILGELRQGALESALVDGIAQASAIPETAVRRAVMLAGDPSPVAVAAISEGVAGLRQFQLQPLSPLKPMLAQPAEDIQDAIASLGEAALEHKLDGARVQIHRVGTDVRIFSRRLHDVTASLPDIVEATLQLPANQVILDGEVLALRGDGRPRPFQETMRRFGRKVDVAAMRKALALRVFLFDIMHCDGADLIDLPLRERFNALIDAAGNDMLVDHIVTGEVAEAEAFLDRALTSGQEGIMAKSLTGTYAAGSRGAAWLKVKQAHSLDLVVLAAEWGSGRRSGWLSNLHLGARDTEHGTFVMLGKTFKGLTDETLEWQTRALLDREIAREAHVVHVRPELVVEIAVNEIQRSPQYPAGLALRFARVKRYRGDKIAAEADTIEVVRKLFARQAGEPA